MLWRVAWRSLGRNRRRVWLTAGAIGFSVLLLTFFMSLQTGSYAAMIDNATKMLSGHIQVQASDYLDNPRLRSTVGNVSALLSELRQRPDVQGAFPRAMAFALVSHEERSFGAQIMGVEPHSERAFSTIPKYVTTGGRYLQETAADEAVVGVSLARNLGVSSGDELVVLGTGNQGSVAALALKIVGVVDSGVSELDRTLLQVPIDTFREAFELNDEANVIVVMAKEAVQGRQLALELNPLVAPAVARAWPQLMPELEQAIQVDRVSGYVLFVLLGVMVVFSIVNTFIMTVFERTREMGMLMAVGMTPGRLQAMLQLEALMMCVIGIVAGSLAATALMLTLSETGVPLGEAAEEAMRGFHMPSRLYPAFALGDLVWPASLMLIATQIAAFLPSLKIRRLQPVEALRAI